MSVCCFKSEAVRSVSDQRRGYEAQRHVERQQVFRRVALLVQLTSDYTSEVAEAVDTKDERSFAGLGCVTAEPCHCKGRRDVAAEEEDAETDVFGAVCLAYYGHYEADEGDEDTNDDVVASFFAVVAGWLAGSVNLRED